MEAFTWAAGLDHLVGVDLDVAAELGVGADQAPLADHGPRLDAGPGAQVAGAPEHGALDPGRRPEVGVLADHRALQLGPLGHLGVGADASSRRPSTASRSIVQFSPMNAGESMRTDGSMDESLPTQMPGRSSKPDNVDLDLAVEDVLVRLEVRRRGADVLPVAVGHVAVEGLTRLEHGREDLAGEVDGTALGDAVEDLRLEHVDAGVDGVAEHLAPARLLQEALDASRPRG